MTKKKLSYQGCPFHRIISGFMAQGGDTTRGDGTGGESIFGTSFPDENFIRPHDSAGLLSMANSGPDTNGSQFFLTFRDTPHLNRRHVVFGKVIEGFELLSVLENVSTDSTDTPRAPVVIAQCGQIGQELPLSISSSSSSSTSSSSSMLPDGPANEHKDHQQQLDKEEDEPEKEEEVENETPEQIEARHKAEMAGMTPQQQRLFRLRLRINQGRKLNQQETEKEFKVANDPAFARKERAAERYRQQLESGETSDAAGKGTGNKKTGKKKGGLDVMSQTAGECEQLMTKKAAKERNVASFGWEAFTAEASYRAYNKKLSRLPSGDITEGTSTGASEAGGSNPLSYGKGGSQVTSNGLNRMVDEIKGNEASRLAYSRRRMSHEATTVDHISDRNEHFNKKLKRTLDKYTVEIRQNLERGTAL